jgi:hypothetical protein
VANDRREVLWRGEEGEEGDILVNEGTFKIKC